jgi:hypothetical protein
MAAVAAWLVVVVLVFATAGTPRVLESAYAARDPGLSTDPAGEAWGTAPRVLAGRDRMGDPVPGPPTEIRSRWTHEHLYLLFICPYTDLNVAPDPHLAEETERLWHRDVVEAFIGADLEHIGRYKEFQASPLGEWADLDIDRQNPGAQQGQRWNSGLAVQGRVDAKDRVWYAVMRIPFRALTSRPAVAGLELRLGLFRIAGIAEPRTRYVWQPTGQPTFHAPEAFGILRLR